MKDVQKLLRELAGRLDEFVAAAIVDSEGLALAGVAGDRNTDISIPSGMFARAKAEVDKAFEITNWGTPGEYMFVSNTHIVTLSPLPGNRFLGICVRASANLGMVRAVRNKYIKLLEDALRNL